MTFTRCFTSENVGDAADRRLARPRFKPPRASRAQPGYLIISPNKSPRCIFRDKRGPHILRTSLMIMQNE